MQAEGAIAAVKAGMDYNPATRVPLQIFVARRVMGRAITRYRKEWTHAQLRSDIQVDELNGKQAGEEDLGAVTEEVRLALTILRTADRELIERLFWNDESEAEVAQSLGISQQAVSKRKLSVLRTLQRILSKQSK
jgi:RNA polymerase sigma factor (sigma-70 family)